MNILYLAPFGLLNTPHEYKGNKTCKKKVIFDLGTLQVASLYKNNSQNKWKNTVMLIYKMKKNKKMNIFKN